MSQRTYTFIALHNAEKYVHGQALSSRLGCGDRPTFPPGERRKQPATLQVAKNRQLPGRRKVINATTATLGCTRLSGDVCKKKVHLGPAVDVRRMRTVQRRLPVSYIQTDAAADRRVPQRCTSAHRLIILSLQE